MSSVSASNGESAPLVTEPAAPTAVTKIVAVEVAPAVAPKATTEAAASEQPTSVAANHDDGNARIVEKVETATMTDTLPIEKAESESAAESKQSKDGGDETKLSCSEKPQQEEPSQKPTSGEVQCAPATATTTTIAVIAEKSETIIKETVKELEALELEEVVNAEEPDKLSPLMIDNHTFLQHQEVMREDASPQHHYHHHHHHHGHDEIHDYDLEDDDEEDDELYLEESDHMGTLPSGPAVNMSHSDTKDSISSIDSDVSLSFDRRNSTESQNPPEDAGHGSSDDNAKDSGCEITKKTNENDAPNEDEAFEVPDDELCEKIIEQVEFYFSNDNILKDAFLLKHVRRNKEGFVSLKLVSSFKRVRQLTKDWRVVGDAIKRKSVKIELNDLATKIRRLDPLPVYDETTPSRTVVATGLPYDKYTVEKVSELFSKCGEISLIRVLRPGGPIPADVRQFINKHPELQQNECALIEFTESSSARRAQNMEEFIVLELVAPKKKTGKKANVTKFVENLKFVAGHDIERSRGGEAFDRFKMRRGSGGFYPKPDMQHMYQQMIAQPMPQHEQPPMPPMMPLQQQMPPQQQPMFIPHSPQQRKYSYGNENFDYFNRRPSQFTMGGNDPSRKYSSCSEGYSSCGEMSRRTSQCSSIADSMSRRTSNCSEVPSRRSSNCSDFCTCSRRISQCSDMYRRMSQCSDHSNRKFSVGSNYERKFTNSPEMGMPPQRRISMDNNYERKFSQGPPMGFESPNISPRKYSNSFDPLRKLSSTSDYYQGRRISTDSGYDRRISIDSDYSAGAGPRSRSGSAVQMQCQQHGQSGEAVVRTPIGPDGSKGFGSRTRRVGQIVPPA